MPKEDIHGCTCSEEYVVREFCLANKYYLTANEQWKMQGHVSLDESKQRRNNYSC